MLSESWRGLQESNATVLEAAALARQSGGAAVLEAAALARQSGGADVLLHCIALDSRHSSISPQLCF